MKLNLKKKIFTDVFWLSLSKASIVITGLIGLRLLTELADPSVFGEANLIIGLTALGLQFFGAPFFQSISRLFPDAIANNQTAIFMKVLNRFLGFSTLALLVVMSAIFILDVQNYFPSFDFKILLILYGYVICFVIKSIYTSVLNAQRNQRHYSFWLASEAVMILGFIIAFLLHSASTASFLMGHFCGMLACIALNLLLLGRSNTLRFKDLENRDQAQAHMRIQNTLKNDILKFGWPWAIFAFLNWTAVSIDRYIVAAHLDVYEAGKFVAVYSIATRLASFPASIIHSAFRPLAYQAISEGNHEKWKKSCWIWIATLVLSGVIIIGATILSGKLLLSLLIAKDFITSSAPVLMIIMVMSGVVSSLVQAVEMIMLSKEPSSSLILPKFLGAFGTIVLCLWLIQRYSLMGAAYGTLFGFIFSLVLLLLAMFYNRAKRSFPQA